GVDVYCRPPTACWTGVGPATQEEIVEDLIPPDRSDSCVKLQTFCVRAPKDVVPYDPVVAGILQDDTPPDGAAARWALLSLDQIVRQHGASVISIATVAVAFTQDQPGRGPLGS